jgi:hypothetical protein
VLGIRDVLVRKIEYRYDHENQADDHRYKTVLIGLTVTHLTVLLHAIMLLAIPPHIAILMLW